jgi:hypothetical protein
MQNSIIEIKKPCFVNLDSVIADEKGKWCSVCQTSVIDFTNKSPEEIAAYLQNNSAKSNCGTFNSWDVKTNSKTDQLISYLQSKKLKFLAVFVIGVLILTGCRVRTKGVVSHGQNPRILNEASQSIENVK